MKRIGICVLAAALFMAGTVGLAEEESLLSKLLRFTGISASPSQQKGVEGRGQTGEVWIAPVAGREMRQVSATGGFRSPIFHPDNRRLLALRGPALVEFNVATGGERIISPSLSEVVKLVGFEIGTADRVLVLRRSPSFYGAAVLDLSSGSVTNLGANSPGGLDAAMLAHLEGTERVYGDQVLYVKRSHGESVTGPEEWSDVYLKTGSLSPKRITDCRGAWCGQPSLSSDGRMIAFIRSDSEP